MIIQVSIKSLTHLLKAHEDLMQENKELAERIGQKVHTKAYEDLLRKWEAGNDRIRHLERENKGLAHENKINKQQYDLHLEIIARQTQHVQLVDREAKGLRKENLELKHQRNQAWHDRGTLGRSASEEITTLMEENKRLAAGICEKEEEIDRLRNRLKIKSGWLPPVKLGTREEMEKDWQKLKADASKKSDGKLQHDNLKVPHVNQCLESTPRNQNGVMHTHGDWHMRKDKFQREAADKTDSRTVLD